MGGNSGFKGETPRHYWRQNAFNISPFPYKMRV